LALAGSVHVTTAASPLYVVCSFANATDLFIVVDNFGGVGAAIQHCVQFWRGVPRGVMN
jgi:hypothetical protein